MFIDMNLLLRNVQVALSHQQHQHATFLLDTTLMLAECCTYHRANFPLDVSPGLHRGQVRAENQDCVFAFQGISPRTQEAIGLFLVADGMGGHSSGQEAAHLAIRTIVDQIVPVLIAGHVSSEWEMILAQSIQHANHVIYARNLAMERGGEQEHASSEHSTGTPHRGRMGTTLTAALVIGNTASIANVGDSRTYLYTDKLERITQDHSVVAQLLADGLLASEEEIYAHPKRSHITRDLGTHAHVDVDTFIRPFQADDVLLLCSDGLWEMTRDRALEQIVATPWATTSALSRQLLQLANDGGGADNISCIVVQQNKYYDISTAKTITFDTARNRPLLSSSFPF